MTTLANYTVYLDEFIIKLTPPDQLSSAYSITDTFAILIDPESYETVGYQLSEFTKEYLPQLACLKEVWHDEKEGAKYFETYREFHYTPDLKNRIPKKSRENKKYFKMNSELLDIALVPC